jgi:septal ring factor EnvC (AmiA/AmiB activator)
MERVVSEVRKPDDQMFKLRQKLSFDDRESAGMKHQLILFEEKFTVASEKLRDLEQKWHLLRQESDQSTDRILQSRFGAFK